MKSNELRSGGGKDFCLKIWGSQPCRRVLSVKTPLVAWEFPSNAVRLKSN